MEHVVTSIPLLEQFAKNFLNDLHAVEHRATIVGLSGDLGSGKTALVKAVAKELGIFESVLSPTFVIAKFYDIPKVLSWFRLVHIDAYRIEDTSELQSLRWNLIIADPRNLILVEWPERIGALFPADAQILTFRFINETTRVIV